MSSTWRNLSNSSLAKSRISVRVVGIGISALCLEETFSGECDLGDQLFVARTISLHNAITFCRCKNWAMSLEVARRITVFAGIPVLKKVLASLTRVDSCLKRLWHIS